MVVFTCTKCSRTFSRRFNLERHADEAHGHKKIDEEESDEEMHDGEEVESEEDETEKSSEESEGEDGEEDEQEDGESFWDRIKMAAWTDDLQTKFEVRCQELEQLGMDESKAAHTAAQDMKPFIQESVRDIFRAKVEDMKELRQDEIYKKIMDTKKRIRDEEEDFDEDEAWDYALRKRQYILDRALGIQSGVDSAEFQGSDDNEDGTE